MLLLCTELDGYDNGVSAVLEVLAAANNLDLNIVCVDPAALLDEAKVRPLCDRAREGYFDITLASPPASTTSAIRHRRSKTSKARPMRDRSDVLEPLLDQTAAAYGRACDASIQFLVCLRLVILSRLSGAHAIITQPNDLGYPPFVSFFATHTFQHIRNFGSSRCGKFCALSIWLSI